MYFPTEGMVIKQIHLKRNLTILIKQSLLAFLLIFFKSNFIAAQKVTRVQFSAATTIVDTRLGKDTKRLIGNVVFTHGSTKMYCDSAYFYSKKNSLDAFSNVYINQADTVHLYGDKLHYDGNTRVAQIRNNVRLLNRETTLTTEELDYDIGASVGFYPDHANIVSGENQLESRVGHYYTTADMFDFQDSVVVVNPDYTIYSDRMKYNTETKITYFNGPTEIFGDSSYIYCERGWYNTETDISQLNQNAVVQNTQQTVKGDSLYYEKSTGYGRAVNNVEIIDLDQNIILRGNNGIYYDQQEYARMTDRAEFVQITPDDSLHLHADTLVMELDSNGTKFIKAFYGTRIFKSNLQGKCDSMAYSFADSVIRLYNEPVLWSEESQISAEYIEIQTENRQAKTMYLEKSAFIVSKQDTSHFNQIKGKNMTCLFRRNRLYRVDVNGNGQTVYYPMDNDEVIGANKVECSNMIIYLNEGKVASISFLKNPNGTLYPLDNAPINELILKGFHWLSDQRPQSREDIFHK